MAEETGSKWKKVIIIGAVILFILMVLIGLLAGLYNLKRFFTWLLIGLLIIAILFGLAYIFWLIFIKKTYKDVTASYKKKLIYTAKLMKNEMLGDLYLSGDEKHNRIKLGKFYYMRLNLPKQTKQIIDEQHEGDFGRFTKKKEVTQTQAVKIDGFIVMKTGLMDRLFGEPLFVLTKPEDHNHSSIFNDVTIRGFNLVPLDDHFFTIDKRNLDIDIIKGMQGNYIREVVSEVFKDLDRLVKMSMRLDHEHQKQKEKMLSFDMPQVTRGDDNG